MEQRHKKAILIGVCAAAGAGMLWGLAWLGKFDVYKDKTYGFSIEYPRRWQKVVAPQPGAAVVFVSPKENPQDRFQENVNITVQNVPAEIATLEDFSDRAVLQMTKVFKNIKVAETKDITFGQRRGRQVVFVAEKPDAITILTVWALKGADKAYILTYMAATRSYSTYLPLVQEMIRSFELKN